MKYLVMYDISNKNTLIKVSNTLKLYGVRLQKSIFECELNDSQVKSLFKTLSRLMDDTTDKMFFIPLDKYSKIEISYGNLPGVKTGIL